MRIVDLTKESRAELLELHFCLVGGDLHVVEISQQP